MLLYDADRIEAAGKAPDDELVQAQRELILDPSDPKVVAAAQASGVPDGVIAAAQQSPVYRYVKEWELALPLHPEFRTLPMLFYVPPLLPVLSSVQEGGAQRVAGDMFSSLESARLPSSLHGQTAGRRQRRTGHSRLSEDDGGAPLQARRDRRRCCRQPGGSSPLWGRA